MPPLETGTYISDLVVTNPGATDAKSEGDDHLRLIKSTVKATFPNITGPITASQAELNVLDGITASTAELNLLDGVTATTAELNYIDGVTSPIQTQLDGKQPLDADLTAIAGLSSAGMVARTGAGTASVRTLTAGAGITITNGDGVSGNPTIAVNATDLPNSAAVVSYTPAGTGAVATTVQSKLRERVSVKDFGAVGDGVTDDTTALNNCLEYCRTMGLIACGVSGEVYKISSTLNWNCNADFTGCTVLVPWTLASPAIKTSSATLGVSLIQDLNIKYPSVRNDRVGGVVPTVGSVGIMLEGVRNAYMEFNAIYGFETNLLLYSNDGSRYISYNQFRFNSLFVGAAINIHMLADSTGWVNQCVWNGGQFAQFSADAAAFNAVNLKISKTALGGNNPPNGHTFLGCSMEGAFHRTIQCALNPSIVTSYSSCNTFINCRFEAAVNFEFSALALYDQFVGCTGFSSAAFVGDVVPNNISTTSLRYLNASSPVVGTAGTRASKQVAYFGPSNSGPAVAAAFGLAGNPFRAAITGNGAFQVFSSNTALEHPQVQLNTDGGVPKLQFGDGTSSTALSTIFPVSTQIRTSATIFAPSADLGCASGAAALRWSITYSKDIRPGTGNSLWTSGAGSPEGAVTAPVGSLFTRTDGGAGTTLYIKESGTGATGWVAK